MTFILCPQVAGGRATPNRHALSVRDAAASSDYGSVTGAVLGETNAMSKTLADGMWSAIQGTSDTVTGAVRDTNERLGALLENSGSAAADFSRKATEPVRNHLVNAGCRYTQQFGDLYARLLSGLRAPTERHSLSVRAPADDPVAPESATGAAATSMLQNVGSTVMDLGSETGKSVEEVLRAGGRATLAIGNLCSQLFNGLSYTVATGSDYLASGLNSVDGYLGNVPVVGVVSSGLSKFVTGLSSYVGDISKNQQQGLEKMFNELFEQLNKSGGYLSSTGESTAT